MNNYDPQLAQRVWQRVQGGKQAENPQPPLVSLLYATLADAALCMHIAGQYSGSQAALLRKIAHEKQTHAACLKGILRMNGENSAAATPAPTAERTPQAALRHCIGSTLRCAAQYRQWETQPEYGAVLTVMAQQETVLAQKLLQFWGSLI